MAGSIRGVGRPPLTVIGSLIAGFVAGALAWALVAPRFVPVEAAPPAAVVGSGGAAAITVPATATPTPLWGATPAGIVAPPTPTPIVIPHTPYLLALSRTTPLRAGPGVEFETLRLTAAAEGFDLLGVSAAGGWWAVRLPGVPGNMAWIDGREALVYNAARLPVFTAAERSDIQPIPDKRHLLVVAEAVTLRSGPGVIFASLHVAGRGDWFLLAGSSRDGEWLAVSLDGLSGRLGWVRAEAARTY